MQIVKWNPFKEMNQIFNGSNNTNLLPFQNGEGISYNNWQPTVDVTETDDEFLLKFEVPGIDKKDIDIEVQNGVLTVSGERKYVKTDEKIEEKQHSIESFYGGFSRSFSFPENVHENDIKAEQKNGVLYLHLEKSKEKVILAKKVEIK